MHGGAKGIGAPEGPANGNYRHGRYTREHMQAMRLIRAFAKSARQTLAEL
jgi:hypothetical protein